MRERCVERETQRTVREEKVGHMEIKRAAARKKEKEREREKERLRIRE